MKFLQRLFSSRWFTSPRHRHDLLTAFLLLLPSLIIFGVFVYFSLGFNLYLGFTSWNFLSATKDWVGLENYLSLFSDYRFWNVLGNTAYFAAGSVSLSIVIGLILAVILNQELPVRGLFRTIIFSPYVTTTAAISLLWIWIFQPSYGLINYLLSFLGIIGPRWLGDSNWAMPALIIMNVWHGAGYTMVIFLAGLTSISRELYEASEIDGASKWHSFWAITLPLLSPTTFFLMVTSLINNFKVFDQVAVMTAGGPADATQVFNYFIYRQAFVNFRAGYAASASIVLFSILLLLTVFQLWYSKRWVHYA